MRFSQLRQTTFGNVPMGGEFYVATVAEPAGMAEMALCTKTRLRARRLPEVQADPASLFTVAVNEDGQHRFVAGDDPVWVKGEDNDADDTAEVGDDSGNGANDEEFAGG